MAEATGSSGLVDIKIEIKEEPVFVEASAAESEDLDHTDDPLKEEIKDEEEVDVDLLKDEVIVGEPSCSSEEASRLQFGGSSALFFSTALGNGQRETSSGGGNNKNSSSRVNAPGKRHKCSICGKIFSQSKYLRRHIATHDGVRAHQCEICGKCFASPYYLSDHMFAHKGMRPYTCDTCGKNFSYLSSYKTHCLIHKSVKDHKCIICGKSFSLSQSLKKHMLTHDPGNPNTRLKCVICGKRFLKEETLKMHLLVHNGEKPYKCEVCGKGYTQKGAVKVHYHRSHSKDNAQKSNVCHDESSGTSNSTSHAALLPDIKHEPVE